MGIDAARIGVAGDSSGANLAVATCLKMRDLGGPRPVLQVLAYPVTDYRFDSLSYQENGEGFLLTRAAMMAFWSQYRARPEEGEHPYASVLRADLTALPPTLIITASHDPFRDEGESLAHRMADAGVLTRCIRFNGTIHGFVVRFPIVKAGRLALGTMVDTIRAILADEQPPWAAHLVIEEIGPVV